MGLSILKKNAISVFKLTKKPNYILILAWALPIGILLTILYLNFLPFGYHKTLEIKVGQSKDDIGEFHLDSSSQDLGSRQTFNNNNFRYLDGLVYAVYTPKVVPNNATVEVTMESDKGVSFILPPDLANVKWDYDWNASNMSNDFETQVKEQSETSIFNTLNSDQWTIINDKLNIKVKPGFVIRVKWLAEQTADILKGDIALSQNQKELTLQYAGQTIKYPLPEYFIGSERTAIIAYDGTKLYLATDKGQSDNAIAGEIKNSKEQLNIQKTETTKSLEAIEKKPSFLQIKDGCVYLDGQTRLVIPESKDKFEDGAFTVYTEWTAEQATSSQQIIGHFNWEIWQNEKSVSFQVGRMSTSTGQFYKISYPITEDFFNKKHSLIALYNPISSSISDGYIELFIDDIFVGKQYFSNETIWNDYGGENLSMGWTTHNYEKNPYYKGSICKIKFSQIELKSQKSNKLLFNTIKEQIKFPIYGNGEINELKLNVNK